MWKPGSEKRPVWPLGSWKQLADGFIFVIPIKAFGGLETLVKTFMESDVVSNVTINPWNGMIKVS